MGLRRNIELKARDRDPARSAEICEALGVEDRGVLRQRDTYFEAQAGRLKLREEDGTAAHLIAYRRAELAEQRESQYRMVAVRDPGALKAALTEALGVKVEVAKRRRFFLWQSVRIHLDRVESLGDFIELEAVAPADSDLSHETELVAELREAFGICAADLIGESYADLMLSAEVM